MLNFMKHSDRVYTSWEIAPHRKIMSVIHHCYAIVMPFVLVPSEIPIAVIESMSMSKPVVITEVGGTSDFVSEFGVVVETGNVAELADAMLRLLQDENLYNDKCAGARSQYDNHPSWEDVARTWLRVGEDALFVKSIP